MRLCPSFCAAACSALKMPTIVILTVIMTNIMTIIFTIIIMTNILIIIMTTLTRSTLWMEAPVQLEGLDPILLCLRLSK